MKALVLTSVSILASAVWAQAAFASCGTFEVSKGDVTIQPASGAAKAAAVGAKICAGETVVAGESARAKIKMEDGNELNISPNSKIVIETYQYDVAANKKKVMLNVLRGKVRATTREENMYNDKAKDGQANTFQVRTKSAVAGVRGTDFLTGFDPGKNKMEVVTFRGKVDVGQLGTGGQLTNTVSVTVGQRTEVAVGKAPETPRAVPAGELMKQNNESRNESPGSSSSNGGSSGAGPTAKNDDGGGKKQDRAPASTTPGPGGPASPGPGGMISSNDLPSSSQTIDLPKMPPMPPPVPQLPPSLSNPLINNAIQSGKANVNLNLIIGP